MEKKKITEKWLDTLLEIKKSFDEELIPAQIEEVEDTNRLMILFEDLASVGTDTMGEFFFLPAGEGAQVQVFMNVLTVDVDIDKDRLSELFLAINILNNYLPAGAFLVDLSGGYIVFRQGYEMSTEISDKALKESVDLSMGLSVSIVKDFAYMLLEVSSGERDAESIVTYFNA